MKSLKEIGKKACSEIGGILLAIIIIFAFLLIPTVLGVLAIKLMVSGFSLFLNAAGISLILAILFVVVFYAKDLFNRFRLK